MKINYNLGNKLDSKTKKIIISVLFILANVVPEYLIWINKRIPFIPYNIDNYRYVISAALQSLAAIFAFIASSTIVILQLSADNSPKSIRFFPKKIFILVMIEMVLFIIADGVALITLPQNIYDIHLYFINLVIFYNGISITLVIGYVVAVIRWLQPETMFDVLVSKAKKAKNNKERLDIVLSMEELTLKAVQKGYSSTVKYAIDKFQEITEIYINEKIFLNSGKQEPRDNTDHPLRRIPNSIQRIALSLCNSEMDDLVDFTAWILSPIIMYASSKEDFSIIVSNNFTACRIIKECIQNKLDSAIFNFITNLSYAPEEGDNAEGIASCLRFIQDEVLKLQDQRYTIAEIYNGFFRLAEKHTKQIKVECEQAIRNVKKHPSILQKTGMYQSNTILDQTIELESLLKRNSMIDRRKQKHG